MIVPYFIDVNCDVLLQKYEKHIIKNKTDKIDNPTLFFVLLCLSFFFFAIFRNKIAPKKQNKTNKNKKKNETKRF